MKTNRLDVIKLREDFPTLSQTVHNKRLVYLDNAATTQKPKAVIEAIENYYKGMNGNPHRGAHYLSVKATECYEGAREKVREFINAKSQREIIFTRNATESLNMLAYSFGMNFIEKGDEIVVSIMEHHSNILPWQYVARTKGAILRFMYIDREGRIPESEMKKKITEKTKLVSVAHVSNVLGTINPIKKIVDYAHEKGAVVIIDGAQSVPHLKTDVQDIGADFLVFSAHKMLGPMGIGVLYGKESLLENLPPFLRGGDMIEYVYEQDSTFAELPFRLEAGTQNVEGAVGLSAAIDYINKTGFENIEAWEKELMSHCIEKMLEIPYITILGPKNLSERSGVISFTIEGVHPHDTASIVDADGIALRAGHHCAQPLMRYMNINATSRVSFYFYNTKEEIDIFIDSIKNVRKWLGYGS